MKIVAIIQARMGSTRLPGKVLMPLAGDPMLSHIVRRTQAIQGVDKVVIATTTSTVDDAIVQFCIEHQYDYFCGNEQDVLDRYYQIAKSTEADHILRITADCPLLCFEEAGRLIQHHLKSQADYSHNLTVWGSQMPLGTGTEIFTFAAVEGSWRDGHEPHHREHVDEYIGDHPELFHIEKIIAPPKLRRPELRFTVDALLDYQLIQEIYDRLNQSGKLFNLTDVVELVDAQPKLKEINHNIVQKVI